MPVSLAWYCIVNSLVSSKQSLYANIGMHAVPGMGSICMHAWFLVPVKLYYSIEFSLEYLMVNILD